MNELYGFHCLHCPHNAVSYCCLVSAIFVPYLGAGVFLLQPYATEPGAEQSGGSHSDSLRSWQMAWEVKAEVSLLCLTCPLPRKDTHRWLYPMLKGWGCLEAAKTSPGCAQKQAECICKSRVISMTSMAQGRQGFWSPRRTLRDTARGQSHPPAPSYSCSWQQALLHIPSPVVSASFHCCHLVLDLNIGQDGLWWKCAHN